VWVYIERLEAGTWVNSGSANVDPSYMDKFPVKDLVSKMAISEPMRSYLKKSLLVPYVCTVDVDDLTKEERIPGLILDAGVAIYRFVFLVHRGG